jgi:hypothetical protein
MHSKSTIAMLAAALTLSACGGTAPEGDSAAPSTTAEAKKSSGDWNATDACAMVDKAAMATFLGTAIESTSLGLVNQSDGTTAAGSECTYLLAEGGRAQLLLRQSPINDNTPEAIAMARSGTQQTIDAFGGGKIEDIPGLGKAAFWVGKIDALNVFIGEDRFAIITLPASDAAKDQAIAIAKRLGA